MARRVCFGEELAVGNAGPLANEMLNALQSGEAVEFDLSAVPQVDCAGIQLLLAAVKEAEGRRVPLPLTLSAPIREYAASVGIEL